MLDKATNDYDLVDNSMMSILVCVCPMSLFVTNNKRTTYSLHSTISVFYRDQDVNDWYVHVAFVLHTAERLLCACDGRRMHLFVCHYGCHVAICMLITKPMT